MLTPHVNGITGDHEQGSQCNRLATDQMFCIYQILETKWEYNGTVHQLFNESGKKFCTTEFGTPMKLSD
jgi:hypothetical protein